MDTTLSLIAAEAVQDVYAGKCNDTGSTEWASTVVEYQGQPIQVLAIGGTNELLDWFWNIFLVSWDGVKIGSYLAAHLIHSGTWGKFDWLRKKIRLKADRIFIRDRLMPLLVAVHSKSGPTGLYWKKIFGADHCIAFCPARGCRKPWKMDNTTIFIDPDDPVPMLGFLNFCQPDCELVTLPNDPGLSVSDHFLDHIIEYLNQQK